MAQPYFVRDVLSKIREDRGLSESGAKVFLAEYVKSVLAGPAGDPHKRPQPEQVLWPKNSYDMVVGATRDGHKRVADALEAFRRFGTAEIIIEVRFIALRPEMLQEVLPDSTLSPLNVDEAALASSNAVQPVSFERPLNSHEGTRVARAQLTVEKELPVRFRIVDKEQGEKLIDRCQEDKRTNILQAPKVKVLSGQTAFVSDTAIAPFVIGVIPIESDGAKAQMPQIRQVSEGTTLRLRPVAERSGAIHLDFAATFSKVQDVEIVDFNRTPTSGTAIQIPKVATVRMEGGAALKPGQWLLLGGSKAANEVTVEFAVPDETPVWWADWLFGKGKRFKRVETGELVLMLRAEKVDAPR